MENTVGITDLLEHASWVRALARQLTNDDAAADDLVQETWLAALKHPPRIKERAQPWLAEVLRNARRMRFRGDMRRTERELVTHEIEPAHSVDRVVEEVELGRKLAEEVLALDEPYRETLLLHYYRGLTSIEIGERLAVPAGTVRWRMKEGVERLRVRLDRVYGGKRAAWLRALAPLAGAPIQLPGPGTAAPAAKGAFMTKILVATIFAGSAAVVGVHHFQAAASPPPSITVAKAAAATTPGNTNARTAASPSNAKHSAQKLAHDALVQRIKSAQHRAEEATGVPTGKLDKEYVREAIRGIIPLVRECFEHGNGTDGRVVVRFTITGEPSVGGVVANSEVVKDKSTLVDPPTSECIQESIYAAQFPAPEGGGEVAVEYPFVLTSNPAPTSAAP